MKYKNTRTGSVINTSGKIDGSDWVEITPVAPAQPGIKEKEPEKKTAPVVKKTTTKTAAKKPVTKKTTGRK